jgi:dTDP-4-dehydrorhamnose reductase
MWFVDNVCPPDVLGPNYYITSERFIDERLENYPERYHGDNGRHRYADIETARCLAHPTAGLRGLLLEAWERYHLPIAVTEVQLDSEPDDQLRWWVEVWRAAQAARAQGADVRAVTAWALFGSFDWNCLVTECRGYYEPGAFDVRGGTPRPTPLADLLKQLARGNLPAHPVFDTPGWWLRDGRHFCPPVALASFTSEARG